MLSNADKEFLIDLICKRKQNAEKILNQEEPTKEDLYEALEMACQELRNEEQGKTNARFKLQKLKNDLFVGNEMSYEEFFIDQVLRKKKEERENRSGYERRKENYNKLREDYNKSKERDYRDLFLLSCYSINHLIRFNTNSDFNASSGADSYNEKNYKCVCDMHKIFQNVEVRNEDALNFDFSLLDGNDFVYCDIPYLNTKAVYNEKCAFGGWSIESDYKLFKILEDLNAKGVKWGLSNVFSNRGKTNQHLIDWCKKNKWKVFHLERNYNPFSRGNSDNDEVYICNYEIEEKPTQIGMFD